MNMKRSFDSASTSSRRAFAWRAGSLGPNVAVVKDLQTLRNRAHAAVRNSGWAKTVVDHLASAIVGTGIVPRSKAGDSTQRKEIQRLWAAWTDVADAGGALDFYGLQWSAVRAMVEGGEAFARIRFRRPGDGLPVPLQVQLLESEQLPVNLDMTLANGGRIRAGVELSPVGAPAAYHFYKGHPDDGGWQVDATTVSRVPAEFVAHLYSPERVGQLRGVPWVARMLKDLAELEVYNDAELVRKKTAAMFTGWVTRPADDAGSVLGEDDDEDGDGVATVSLEPGTFNVLDAGEEIHFSQPADVGGSFEAFMRWQLRKIAKSAGVMYEMLTGDSQGLSDRTLRVMTQDFRRQIEIYQHHLVIHQFCRPIWRAFIDAAILSGKISLRRGQIAEDLYAVDWVPHGFAYLHPVQDVQAQKMEVDAGFRSRSSVIAGRGFDAEEVDEEIAAEREREAEMGLRFHAAETEIEDDDDEGKP